MQRVCAEQGHSAGEQGTAGEPRGEPEPGHGHNGLPPGRRGSGLAAPGPRRGREYASIATPHSIYLTRAGLVTAPVRTSRHERTGPAQLAQAQHQAEPRQAKAKPPIDVTGETLATMSDVRPVSTGEILDDDIPW